jgi:hypothetical protein
MGRNAKSVLMFDPDEKVCTYLNETKARERVSAGHAKWVPNSDLRGRRSIQLVGVQTRPLSSPASLTAIDSERAAGLNGPLSNYHATRIRLYRPGESSRAPFA